MSQCLKIKKLGFIYKINNSKITKFKNLKPL